MPIVNRSNCNKIPIAILLITAIAVVTYNTSISVKYHIHTKVSKYNDKKKTNNCMNLSNLQNFAIYKTTAKIIHFLGHFSNHRRCA